ncbi:MAG: ABC transporter permease [Anaerolineales bacterium]|nr:ABC transporter permease [Anaerolineales bacterium]
MIEHSGLLQPESEQAVVESLDEFLETTTTAEPLTFGKIAVRRLMRDRLTIAALLLLTVLVLLSILADVFSVHVLKWNPNSTDLMATFQRPSSAHLLGTDQLGRDQLTRLLFGGRVSLAIGFSGSFIAMTLGVFIGIAAGFFGGFVDDIIMFFINTLQSIPTLFLLLIIVALFSPSALWLTLIFGFLGWMNVSRIVRGEVFSVRERDYVIAARALGSSEPSIMMRHILPNIIPIVIIIAARDIGSLILSESALSFLGLGIQPPTATWGNMLSKAQQYFILGPHLVIFPGVLITITVLSLYLIGDGLRDALDPRLK